MLKPTINLQTLTQHSSTVISFILVIACAHALAQLTWILVPPGDSAATRTNSSYSHIAVNTETRRNDIGKVAMAHLFGAAENTAIDSEQVTTVTRLNLVLRGVFAASDPKYGIAIISSGKDGDEEVYGVGDRLPGNATLHEVQPDSVILQRNGRLEILKLPKDTSADLANITGNNSFAYQPGSSPGEAFSEIRRNILRNPASFGNYALPIVIRENGRQIGYRLIPQPGGKELLREIGLEPNDIITSVDGVKLDNPRNGISALSRLSTAQSANITVKRNGAEVPLTIQLH